VWVEYWAPTGAADTQRYAFREDGQFTWAAPANTQTQQAARKAGRFELERQGVTMALVLHVSAEEFAACAVPCVHAGADSKHVDHAPALVERYELGECAPNVEARALDQQYACVAIAGHAFWRRPPSPALESQLLWTAPKDR
jgi:hypothetical protein